MGNGNVYGDDAGPGDKAFTIPRIQPLIVVEEEDEEMTEIVTIRVSTMEVKTTAESTLSGT
eukprot:scaffold15407_cov58-Attheya_sp.AAC.2